MRDSQTEKPVPGAADGLDVQLLMNGLDQFGRGSQQQSACLEQEVLLSHDDSGVAAHGGIRDSFVCGFVSGRTGRLFGHSTA